MDYTTQDPTQSLESAAKLRPSSARSQDSAQLIAFRDYRELNESFEPLQTNWIVPDNDNYHEVDWEEGDVKKPVRDAEAEWEMRPSVDELMTAYGNGHDREIIGFHKDRIADYEKAARLSLAGLAIRRTQKQIDIYVDRIIKPERLQLDDVAKRRKWVTYRIGDLQFAHQSTKKHYRGEITHYRKNGRWHPVKDQYGTPYGPKAKGSNNSFWKPLCPRADRLVTMLPPKERAKQLAAKRASVGQRISCQPMTAEEYELFRVRHQPHRPANDNDGLPYDVESEDELRFGYAFGKSYADAVNVEPFDDVMERKQLLAALNASLTPQTLLVANLVVQTDQTETTPAQNYADVGAMVAVDARLSKRTLIRRGQAAVAKAAEEIGKRFQELAA